MSTTETNLSDPGPENRGLLKANPSSNDPPFTDHGNPGPLWYSFDLAPKRVQSGGWTHQVTQRELPTSTEIAGVNMRLTTGSFRELHWHKANEWAIMLTGKLASAFCRPMAKCSSTMWRRAIFGIFPQVFHTRSRVWRTVAASFCSFSTRVISPKTTHFFFRNFWRTRLQSL